MPFKIKLENIGTIFPEPEKNLICGYTIVAEEHEVEHKLGGGLLSTSDAAESTIPYVISDAAKELIEKLKKQIELDACNSLN